MSTSYAPARKLADVSDQQWSDSCQRIFFATLFANRLKSVTFQ